MTAAVDDDDDVKKEAAEEADDVDEREDGDGDSDDDDMVDTDECVVGINGEVDDGDATPAAPPPPPPLSHTVFTFVPALVFFPAAATCVSRLVA